MRIDIDRIRQLQDFFFKCGLLGYAGGGTYTPVADLQGGKKFEYEEGDMRYVDSYVTFGAHFSGLVLIYEKIGGLWQPAWFQRYGGEEWIPHPGAAGMLKEAMRAAYEAKDFVGGRGPKSYPADWSREDIPVKYYNEPAKCFAKTHRTSEFGFLSFAGVEFVVSGDARTEHIYCMYDGGLLGHTYG